MEMTVDFSDFGKAVDVKVPPASKVTDVTDTLAGAGAGVGSGVPG